MNELNLITKDILALLKNDVSLVLLGIILIFMFVRLVVERGAEMKIVFIFNIIKQNGKKVENNNH